MPSFVVILSFAAFFFLSKRRKGKRKKNPNNFTLHVENKKNLMSKLRLSMILNSPCLLNSFSNICDQIYLKIFLRQKRIDYLVVPIIPLEINGSHSEE